MTNLQHLNNSTVSGGGPTYQTLANNSWQYDKANRVTQFVSPDGTENYTYDTAGQLTGASGVGTSLAYTYDANGNRTNPGYTTTADNRVTTDGTYNYIYDHEGNVYLRQTIATNVIRSMSYDNRNRLIDVADFQSDALHPLQDVQYTYDVFDRRVSRTLKIYTYGGAGEPPTSITTSQEFVYDGDHVIFDFAFDGSTSVPTKRYLNGAAVDQVFAQENTDLPVTNADRAVWFLKDNQGSTQYLINNVKGLPLTPFLPPFLPHVASVVRRVRAPALHRAPRAIRDGVRKIWEP